MTTYDALDLLGRRWYLVILGLALTVLCGVTVLSRPPVWSSQVDVVLVPPKEQGVSTTLVDASDGLISMAGLVEREVNKDHPLGPTTSQDVPLVGTGVRKGTLIRQPNSGGQWDWYFTQPSLSIQVAGPDHDVVQRDRDRAVARVQRTLLDLQVANNIRPSARITSQVSPSDAAILLHTGHRSRAAAGLLVLGTLITGAVTAALDRLLLLRRRRRRADVDTRAPRQRVLVSASR